MLTTALFLFAGLVNADQAISAAGVTVKVKGQSGKMTITIPSGNSSTSVECQMVALRQLDAVGNTLGGGGSEKHSFNSFATQSFTFSEPMDDSYQNVSVAKITFDSTLVGSSRIKIHTFIFKEAGTLIVGNDVLNVSAGAVKFNVELGSWSWCGDDVTCKGAEGLGDSVELDLSISAVDAAEGNGRRLLFVNGSEVNETDDNETMTITSTDIESQEHDLGGIDLTMLSTYSSDGGETWSAMPEGYPKVSGSTFTLKFPRWSGSVIYDPILQGSTSEDADGPGQMSSAAVFKLHAILFILALSSLLV